MSFEERARRAVEDIHRSVEVMEMSDTKTSQRLARFDQYRTRTTRNQRLAAIAVGIGLPIVLVILALSFLRSDGEPDAVGGQPSTSARPEPARSLRFEAPFTYTLPPGWTLSRDLERYFEFEGPGSADVAAYSYLVPARLDCLARPDRDVGTSSHAMASWLSRHPALDATAPVDVRLGAATGSWLDVRLADDWDRSCPNDPDPTTDGPTVLTGFTTGPIEQQGWTLLSVSTDEKIRFYIVDVPSGDTVTIRIRTGSPEAFDDLIDEAASVVESLEFLG